MKDDDRCEYCILRYWQKSSIYVSFQAEDGISALVRSRGLGEVYKGQPQWMTLMFYNVVA